MNNLKELETFVLSTKVGEGKIKSNIIHPVTKKEYPARTFFVLLRKYAFDFLTSSSEPRMIGLAGLRGVGKTTLMWQLAHELFYNHKIPEIEGIFFFNVNTVMTLNSNLFEVLEIFQNKVLKKRFYELSKPIVLLFDEVHDDPNWAKTLKILYDEAKTAFVVCTGSSALLLQQTADLSRRMNIEKIYPFKLTEFILAKSFFETNNNIYPKKDLSKELKTILFFSQDANELYQKLKSLEPNINNYYNNVIQCIKPKSINSLIEEYLKYYNIPAFILYKEKSLVLNNILDLFHRVIYEDLPKIQKEIVSSREISKLLLQLAISDEINYDSLSKKTGIKKENLDCIIDIIEKAELINKFNPYGGSEARIWKNKKIFFMSPSLRLALLNEIYQMQIPETLASKVYEDIVVMYLKKTLAQTPVSFVMTENYKTPDFVIETMDNPILIEIGKGKTTTEQLHPDSIKARYGILITENQELSQSGNNIKLPLSWFLLL